MSLVYFVVLVPTAIGNIFLSPYQFTDMVLCKQVMQDYGKRSACVYEENLEKLGWGDLKI